MYLRALRAVFNEAIAQKMIKKDECYPFGRRLYRIPTGRNIKKALELPEIQKIYNHLPETESELKARDFWLFSYFGNVMNVKDIALLKYKDIKRDYLVFIRAKTERTTREDLKPVVVYITEGMLRIMERWGNTDKEAENYIFPILTPGMTAQGQYDNIQLFIKFINKWMSRIKGLINIDKKVTTIVTRHSFSSVLKRSGASTEFIQEALGHTDKKTTENYLDSFEDETKRQFAEKLSAFKQLP